MSKTAKTYKLDEHLVEEFKNTCQKLGKSQASQLETLMRGFISEYSLIFERQEAGKIDCIENVGNLLDFLSIVPEDTPIRLNYNDENFRIDSYTINDGEISIFSEQANFLIEKQQLYVEGVKKILKGLL